MQAARYFISLICRAYEFILLNSMLLNVNAAVFDVYSLTVTVKEALKSMVKDSRNCGPCLLTGVKIFQGV